MSLFESLGYINNKSINKSNNKNDIKRGIFDSKTSRDSQAIMIVKISGSNLSLLDISRKRVRLTQ